MKLRALCTQAAAACEAQEKQDALASLWDKTLQFESEPSGADRLSIAALQNFEKRRHKAAPGQSSTMMIATQQASKWL
jgi:hypothetical protein